MLNFLFSVTWWSGGKGAFVFLTWECCSLSKMHMPQRRKARMCPDLVLWKWIHFCRLWVSINDCMWQNFNSIQLKTKRAFLTHKLEIPRVGKACSSAPSHSPSSSAFSFCFSMLLLAYWLHSPMEINRVYLHPWNTHVFPHVCHLFLILSNKITSNTMDQCEVLQNVQII